MPTLSDVFSSRYEYLKDSWSNNLRVVVQAAELLRSNLGPYGAYKMVTYNRGPEQVIKITKDPIPILEELSIQYPIVTILLEAAKMQRQEIGDGVTSFIIFTSALLKNANNLVSKKIHPSIILNGYYEAAKKAIELIKGGAQDPNTDVPKNILSTVDCGRGYLTKDMETMLLDAANMLTTSEKLDRDKVCIIKKAGGNSYETKLTKGLTIKKNKCHPNMPDEILKPRIAVTSGRIGPNRIELKMPGQGPFPIKVEIETPEDRIACKEAETQQKAAALRKLEEYDVNVLFSQQPIDGISKNRLQQMGILAFESVDRNDLCQIVKATGAKMVSNLAELSELDIGGADRLETEKIALENVVILEGCDFITFTIRGSTRQEIDEVERLINNSLSLLKIAAASGRTVAGGGSIEVQVATQLKKFALQFSGREQLAIDSFAKALLEIPWCLAANAGLSADEILAQLNKFHTAGFADYGISSSGICSNACTELAEVKISVIQRAFEVVTLMLRIDHQIKSKELVKFHKK